MKLLLVIRKDAYDGLLSVCDAGSPQDRLLKNGIIQEDGDGQTLHLLANRGDLEALLECAKEKFPAAQPFVGTALEQKFSTNIQATKARRFRSYWSKCQAFSYCVQSRSALVGLCVAGM